MTDVTRVLWAPRLARLGNFRKQTAFQLGIVERDVPAGADAFFARLLRQPLEELFFKVRRVCARDDILAVLEEVLPARIIGDAFFMEWIKDMADVCRHFCAILQTDEVAFWLGSDRGCVRYHVDSTPFRALVTYAGTGTEWLPNEACDRAAYAALKPNAQIVKDPKASRFLGRWDFAVFRGEPDPDLHHKNGIIHRTPEAAQAERTLLMRLDDPSFFDEFAEDDDEN